MSLAKRLLAEVAKGNKEAEEVIFEMLNMVKIKDIPEDLWDKTIKVAGGGREIQKGRTSQ